MKDGEGEARILGRMVYNRQPNEEVTYLTSKSQGMSGEGEDGHHLWGPLGKQRPQEIQDLDRNGGIHRTAERLGMREAE